MKKYKPRPFSVNDETLSKLDDIKKLKGQASVSATLRYCVDYVYGDLFADASPGFKLDRLTNMLQFTLFEVTKLTNQVRFDKEPNKEKEAIAYFEEIMSQCQKASAGKQT